MTDIFWHRALEVGNGLGAIVACWLAVFMVYHLLVVGVQRRIWLRGWCRLPLSMQLAAATAAIATGYFLQRFPIWWGRFWNDSVLAMAVVETAGFLAGTAIIVFGFLCALRVVTKPMLGPWPWWGAVGTSLAYLAWSGWRFL